MNDITSSELKPQNIKSNVINIHDFKNGIIKEKNKVKEDIMEHLDVYSKNEIDLKLNVLEQKMDSNFNSLMSKLDSLPLIIENSILKNNEMLRKENKETRYWMIGLTVSSVIAVAGIFIPMFFK